MPPRTRLASLLLLAAILGCGKPVPPEKTSYLGSWMGPGTTLLILQEGRVQYERKIGNSTTTINGPIQNFEGDDFRVGIAFLSKRFVVTKPPYREGNGWKMVVDGVELTRPASESDPPPPVESIPETAAVEGAQAPETSAEVAASPPPPGETSSSPGDASYVFKVQKLAYAPSEAITVEFAGLPGNDQDWITLVKATTPDHQYDEWYYLRGKRNGTMDFRNPGPGDYEARLYFNWPQGGYQVQRRIRISVKSP